MSGCKFFKKVYENHIKLKYIIGKTDKTEKYIYNIDYVDYLKDIYFEFCNDDYCEVKCDVNICIVGDSYVFKKCSRPTDVVGDVKPCSSVSVDSLDIGVCNDIQFTADLTICNELDLDVGVKVCNNMTLQITPEQCSRVSSITGVVYDNIATRTTNNN